LPCSCEPLALGRFEGLAAEFGSCEGADAVPLAGLDDACGGGTGERGEFGSGEDFVVDLDAAIWEVELVGRQLARPLALGLAGVASPDASADAVGEVLGGGEVGRFADGQVGDR